MLAIFQTIQIVEVLHCVVGLVPSNPLITLQQTAVKLAIVFGIVSPFAGPKNCYGILLTIGCWSVAEITRYLYYALNILNVVPYLVTWCRYSFFLVLYPFGVLGELLLIYASLDEISKSSRFTWPLPNFLNVSFYPHYALVGFMLLYIPRTYAIWYLVLNCPRFKLKLSLKFSPVFPPMYIHMLRQRRKIIGGVF